MELERNKGEQKRLKLAVGGLLLVGVFLGWHGFEVLREKIYQPKGDPGCVFGDRQEFFSRFNLLVDLSPPTLASFLLERAELTLMILPQSVIGDEVSVGEEGRCLEVVIGNKISRVVAMPVDGYLLLDQSDAELTPEDLMRLKSWKIFTELKTDLSLRELVSIRKWSQSLRSRGVNLLDLAGPHFFDFKKNQLYKEAGDSLISDSLFDPRIREEGVRVAVFNGSDTRGAASEMGRYVANLGARLVMVENLTTLRCQSLALDCREGRIGDQSILLVPESLQSSQTVRRMFNLLKQKKIVNNNLPSQADVFWVIGQGRSEG
jgi:hypothetical protein